jgi:hypothetical protein
VSVSIFFFFSIQQQTNKQQIYVDEIVFIALFYFLYSMFVFPSVVHQTQQRRTQQLDPTYPPSSCPGLRGADVTVFHGVM